MELDLDAEQQRLLQKTYDGFVRSGASRRRWQARLAAINEGSSQRCSSATTCLPRTTASCSSSVPSSSTVRPRATATRPRVTPTSWGWRRQVGLHAPQVQPAALSSPIQVASDLRERIYKAYLTAATTATSTIIREPRQRLRPSARGEGARLLGYPSYAAYVADGEMARTHRCCLRAARGALDPGEPTQKAS